MVNDCIITIDQILYTCGMRCPEPIMMVRKVISSMIEGCVLLVIADDYATTKDIPSFCRFMGHILLKKNINSLPYCYFLRKGYTKK